MSTNTDKKAGLYFILTTVAATEDSTTQAMATLNHEKPTLAAAGSIASGYSSVVVDFASGIADAASKAATGAEAEALKNVAKKLGNKAGVLGLAQVAFDVVDNHNQGKSWEELSAGELLNVAAAISSMVPGLQVVGFALAGVSVAYSIYEDKNGKITIGEFFEHLGTKMDDLVKKFKGDEFDDIKVNIGKLDAKLLDLLPENSLEQKAIMEQFDHWHTAKITSGEYKGERFFADNEDALQYTTAAGEGYANAGGSSRYVTSLLLNLADELGDNSLLTFGKNLHQWNVVTNQKGVEVSAMDGDKTQFMLGNIGNDTLIGGNQNDVIIGKDGDDRIVGGKGSDQLYGGTGFDTYEFKTGEMQWDYIFDASGDGQILIDGVNVSTFQFKLKPNSHSIWEYDNGYGNWWAMLIDNDLTLMLGSERLVIKNYRLMGGNQLGIVLSDEVQPETSDYLLWTGDIRPNTKIYEEDGAIIDTGIYDVNWTDHSQRNEKGEIINGIKQDGFNDVIKGQAGKSNKIYGLGGNDALSGQNNDDLISGGDGDDLIAGGGGSDTIYGGNGNDFIYSNWVIDFRLRYSENDQWIPSDDYYISTITQGSTWGVYSIEENTVSYIVEAGYSSRQYKDDLVQTGDTLYGGCGDDSVVGGNNNDIIYGDELEVTEQDGNDRLYGMGGDDLIYAGNGDDFINGDGAIDLEDQTTFQYSPIEEHGNDIIDAGDGNDSVYGSGGNDFIIGGVGNDWISGDFEDKPKSAEFADANGDDFIDGGDGHDEIRGGGGNDYLIGGAGNDWIDGDYYNLLLAHISGDDTIDGGDGNDTVYGGGGDDFIIGGAGNDWISGDLNNAPETAEFADADGNDTIDAGDGNDTIHGGGGDDHLIGGDGDDRIWGDYANPELADIAGDDNIDGGDGDDQIEGGGGDDYLIGGNGDDLIIGDKMDQDLTHITGNDTLDGGDGNDQLLGGAGDDHIIGGNGNDMIWGDFDSTIKTDIAGNDYLDGGDGNDKIWGGDGDDTIIGGAGDDYLDGGDGDDTLIAGQGRETLCGRQGNDRYLFNHADLQEKNIKTIIDEDGKGSIIIDDIALENHDWKAIAENVWEANNMGLVAIEENGTPFLIWQSTTTNTHIAIQNYKNGDLNLNLPKYQPKPIITVNHEPIVNLILTEQTIKTNEEYSFRLPENLFVDPDGDDLTLSIENLPNWLHFDGHTLSGTPLIGDTGNLKINITATDPYGASTSQTLELNIENPNQAPAVDQIIATQTITANQEWTFRLPENMFIDPDGDDLSFEINNLPNWLKFDGNTLSGTPTMDDLGSLKFEIIAKDPYGETASQTLEINIQTPSNAIMVSQNKIGSLKADLLIGNEANNTIRGNADDDEIYGMDGNDTLYGGIGNDVLYGGNGADILNGGIGDDTLYGGNDNDTLNGDAGNDILKGGNGEDTLNGGIGNDTLHGGVGNDILNGGLGNDIYIFNKGDGYDSINDLGGNDTLKIEANLGELWFAKDGKNINISMIGTDDTITIENAFSLLHRVENIETEDGRSFNYQEVNNILNTQNSFAYDSNLSGSLNDQMLEFNQTHGIL